MFKTFYSGDKKLVKVCCEYKYSSTSYSKTHLYTAIGRYGGVHLSIIDFGDSYKGDDCYSSCLEFHYRHPPLHMVDDVPYNYCWLMGGPCWHDRISFYAQDVLIPEWLINTNDHEYMFSLLQIEYNRAFITYKHLPLFKEKREK